MRLAPPSDVASSARAKASALRQRFAGSFSSARKIAASSSTLRFASGAALRGGFGGSSMCMRKTAIGESATNGFCPTTM